MSAVASIHAPGRGERVEGLKTTREIPRTIIPLVQLWVSGVKTMPSVGKSAAHNLREEEGLTGHLRDISSIAINVKLQTNTKSPQNHAKPHQTTLRVSHNK